MARVLDVEPAAVRTGRFVGTVGELWRYPVKSMLGSRISAGARDRAWLPRRPRVGAARPRQAAGSPAPSASRSCCGSGRRTRPSRHRRRRGRARIPTPDGRSIFADDPAASAIISEILGHELRLESEPRADEKTGIDRRTVFGDVSVSPDEARLDAETMPDYFQLKSGSFFEIGAVFVLTSGTAAHLGRLQGATGPADRRRFRPNLYLDTGPGPERFIEDEWAGRSHCASATTRADRFRANALVRHARRCPRRNSPRDLSVLRTAAQHHARVSRRVRVGALLREWSTSAIRWACCNSARLPVEKIPDVS